MLFVDYPVKVIHIHKKIGVLKYANSFRLLEKPSFDNKKNAIFRHNSSVFTVFLASAKNCPEKRFSASDARPFSTFIFPCEYKFVLSHSMHMPHPGIL